MLSSYTSRIIALGIFAVLAKYCFISRNDGIGLTLNDCLKRLMIDQGLGKGFMPHVNWKNASHICMDASSSSLRRRLCYLQNQASS